MTQGEILHGFQLISSQELKEINAVMHRYQYLKNGADLIWLERNDDNKTFAIAFKTIPQDDTGVFHILEHSVLNGSEKYPVKEPFVELLKSSLATFLNAFTFPDKTMYPVCSRNDRDFLNLIDVYMDAVLHPLSIHDPHAFRQEGWHYELDDPEGELRVNGVVYSEMKGAYTSPDEMLGTEMNRLLFPDNCYGFEPGGHPDHIPDLTYENYLASHARFYHPSNARIILDGRVDIDAVFAKLDAFLASYDRIDPNAEIPMQSPVAPEAYTAYYPIDENEQGDNKALLGRGWVYGTFREQEKGVAMAVLSNVLCGSNDAPLTDALLKAGLCEDVSLGTADGIQQPYLLLTLKNVKPENADAAWALVQDTLSRLSREGLDHKRLSGLLSHMEFLTREKDYGGMPKGLIYAITAMETWLYGGDPAQNLCVEKVFASLREKINQGYFEALLRETMLDNPHCATVSMLPSKTIAEEKRKKEQERLSRIKAGWQEDDIRRVIQDFQTLRARQEKPDTEEELSTLPRLTLRDIPSKRALVPQEEKTVENTKALYQPLDTAGIQYLTLYFSLKDLSLDELAQASALSELIGKLDTARFDRTELNTEINDKLGRFSVYSQVFSGNKEPEPMLCVHASLLSSRQQDAVVLLDEILNHTRFEKEEDALNLLRKCQVNMEQQIMMRGNSFASLHASRSVSTQGAMNDQMQGMGCFRKLQETVKGFDSAALSGFAALAKKIFCRSRLTLSLCGAWDEAWLKTIVSLLPVGEMGERASILPQGQGGDGFIIPSEIGFAARCGMIPNSDPGARQVAAQFLTLDYLWNTIRVKGGAYGTGLRVSRDGSLTISSYRDPNAAQSLSSFCQTANALKEFCDSGSDLEKYIISTIGNIDPLLTPRSAGALAAALWFSGITDAQLEEEWAKVLSTTKESLSAFADQLEKACASSIVCVIGGRKALEDCGELLSHLETL